MNPVDGARKDHLEHCLAAVAEVERYFDLERCRCLDSDAANQALAAFKRTLAEAEVAFFNDPMGRSVSETRLRFKVRVNSPPTGRWLIELDNARSQIEYCIEHSRL